MSLMLFMPKNSFFYNFLRSTIIKQTTKTNSENKGVILKHYLNFFANVIQMVNSLHAIQCNCSHLILATKAELFTNHLPLLFDGKLN